jgi:hypothetical protein
VMFCRGWGTHGENLAYFEPAGMHNYVEAVRLWVDERKNYHGRILTQGSGEENKEKGKQCGHYNCYRMAGS